MSDGTPAQWTIILGDNGVGKTTLLQCLAAAQPSPRTLDNANSGKLTKYYISVDGMMTFDHFTSPYPQLRELPLYVKYEVCYDINIQSRTLPTKISSLSIRSGSRPIRARISGTEIDSRNLISYGYGATRKIGKTSLSEPRSESTSASLFSDDVELLNAEEWLLQADYAASRSSRRGNKAKKQRDQILQILIELLPGIDEISFTESPEINNISAPIVEFKTPYGWVPLKGLSLGYRTLITWMVDLAARLFERYPDSNNPLAEPAIVLIDEIDLHLHPRWQRTLMQFLTEKFPNTQFIATAHSPLVVQSAVDANIVLLRREGDHVVIDNDVETIKNWRVDQILTSELFGLESARPPQSDAAMAERNKILSKARLTKADEKRLEELERQIGNLPMGETPEDLQAMDIIRRAAQLLKTE